MEQRLEFHKLRKDIISLKPSQNTKTLRKVKVKELREDDPRDVHPAKRFFMVSGSNVCRYPLADECRVTFVSTFGSC